MLIFFNQINRETNQLFTHETQVKETVQNNTSPCIWKSISNHYNYLGLASLEKMRYHGTLDD